MKNEESKDPCTFCGTRDPSVRRRVFRGDPTLGTYSVPACDRCATARHPPQEVADGSDANAQQISDPVAYAAVALEKQVLTEKTDDAEFAGGSPALSTIDPAEMAAEGTAMEELNEKGELLIKWYIELERGAKRLVFVTEKNPAPPGTKVMKGTWAEMAEDEKHVREWNAQLPGSHISRRPPMEREETRMKALGYRRVRRVVRILLIEDDPARAKKIIQLADENARFVWACSVGKALGILKRDRGKTYQGVMLDHDLDRTPLVPSDMCHDGRDVVRAVIQNIDVQVPILIHSMNREGPAQEMFDSLRKANFYVRRIPMAELTQESLLDWVDDCRTVNGEERDDYEQDR